MSGFRLWFVLVLRFRVRDRFSIKDRLWVRVSFRVTIRVYIRAEIRVEARLVSGLRFS